MHSTRADIHPCRVALLVCATAALAVLPGTAQPAAPGQGEPAVYELPIHVVAGRVMVHADLASTARNYAVNLEFRFDAPDVLALYEGTYSFMEIGDGPDVTVDVRLDGGIDMTLQRPVMTIHPDPEALNRISSFYAQELGERNFVGALGRGFLRNYHVTLDIPAGKLILAPPRVEGSELGGDLVIAPFDLASGAIRVPIRYAGDRNGTLRLGSSEYDTRIDADLAAELGRPAGDVGPVWLSDSHDDRRIDLSRYVAYRPGRSSETHAGDLLVTGVNFLEYFRTEIDWNARSIAFTQKKVPRYPQEDFEFFVAELAAAAGALQQFLVRHPTARLSEAAATQLVARRLQEGADDGLMLEALNWIIDTARTGRRTEAVYEVLARLATLNDRDRADLIIAGGRAALAHSREAVTIERVYQTHNLIGEQYMRKGALKEAWKHFLSAAFMMPDDPIVNLNLARVYDLQGRSLRALSRYERAAAMKSLPAELMPEVQSALERLRPQVEQAQGQGEPW